MRSGGDAPLRYAAAIARSSYQQSQIEIQVARYATQAGAAEQLALLGQAGAMEIEGLGERAILRAQRGPGQAGHALSFTRCGALASVIATARVEEDLLSLDQLSLHAQELDIRLERALCAPGG